MLPLEVPQQKLGLNYTRTIIQLDTGVDPINRAMCPLLQMMMLGMIIVEKLLITSTAALRAHDHTAYLLKLFQCYFQIP